MCTDNWKTEKEMVKYDCIDYDMKRFWIKIVDSKLVGKEAETHCDEIRLGYHLVCNLCMLSCKEYFFFLFEKIGKQVFRICIEYHKILYLDLFVY